MRAWVGVTNSLGGMGKREAIVGKVVILDFDSKVVIRQNRSHQGQIWRCSERLVVEDAD